MTTVMAFQPQVFPRLHMLARIAQCDVAVVMNSAQFVPKNRDGFLGQKHFWMGSANGPIAHAIPVAAGPRDRAITDVQLGADPAWRGKLVARLAADYRKTPGRADMLAQVISVLDEAAGLAELAHIGLFQALSAYDIDTDILPDSELGGRTSAKGGWILDICRELGATRYVCGQPSLDYLDGDLFERHGIEIVVQDWAPAVYPQVWPAPLPNLSYLDALAHAAAPSLR